MCVWVHSSVKVLGFVADFIPLVTKSCHGAEGGGGGTEIANGCGERTVS